MSSRILALIIIAILPLRAHAEWFSDSREIMGTAISVELWHEDAGAAREAIEAVMAEMRRIDESMSPWIETSELAKINREGSLHPVAISDEMMRLLQQSLRYSQLTDGAFDISFASVGYLYDYRKHQQPTQQQIDAHIDAVDYRAIELDTERRTVHFRKPDMRIDLGGIAKGYAVDRGADILEKRGITNAIVTAGGDSHILGDRRGRPWMVGIKNPRDRSKVAVLLPLADTAISTSGDYERFFMDGDRRVHHILNPKTGKSASEVESVSVLAPYGFDTDPLTKIFFVLGIEAGMKFIDTQPGVDAIVIGSDGKLYYSKNLSAPERNQE
jgi:thiamine biosynthesis lipoprotein